MVEVAIRDSKSGLLQRDGLLYPHNKTGKAMTAAEREIHNLAKFGKDAALVDPTTGDVIR